MLYQKYAAAAAFLNKIFCAKIVNFTDLHRGSNS